MISPPSVVVGSVFNCSWLHVRRTTHDDDILREFYVHSDPAMAIGVCLEKAFFFLQ